MCVDSIKLSKCYVSYYFFHLLPDYTNSTYSTKSRSISNRSSVTVVHSARRTCAREIESLGRSTAMYLHHMMSSRWRTAVVHGSRSQSLLVQTAILTNIEGAFRLSLGGKRRSCVRRTGRRNAWFVFHFICYVFFLWGNTQLYICRERFHEAEGGIKIKIKFYLYFFF